MAIPTQVPIQVYNVRGETVTLPPSTITTNFNPGVNNIAEVGSLWINYLNNNAFILTSTEGSSYIWTNISGGGVAGPIDTVHTNTGDVNPVVGAIAIHGGNQVNVAGAGDTVTVNVATDPTFHSVNSTTTVVAGTGMTATTGNIVATAGNISTTAGSISSHTTITAGTGIISTIGDIVAGVGDVIADSGTVRADDFTFSVPGTTIKCGIGNPNGIVTAQLGSLFLSTSGDDVDNRLFINSDSGTTWVAITTAS